MGPAATSTPEGWRALLARPGYPSFVVTVTASRVIGIMFNTAGVLLVLARTGDATLAGAVTAAALLPAALAGPVLGAWLDVARRRRRLIVLDKGVTAAALALFVLLAGHAPGWTLVLVAAAYGVSSPLSTGSFASALSALSGPVLLDRASTVEATSLNLSVIVGPALAGGLAGLVGAARVLELEIGLTVLVAAAVALSPAFDARGEDPPGGGPGGSIVSVVREGTRALLRHRLLRDVALSSLLASFSWGLMFVAFPLYAAHALHSHRNAGGYLWAAVALGSILGTFLLAGAPSRRRVAGSYAVLGLSALLWLLAGSLLAGFALIVLSGITEGPAYSGQIALRQRHAPAGARTQVLNTMSAFNLAAISLGSLVGGALARPSEAFLGFCVVNLVAALVIGRPGRGAGSEAGAGS